MSAYIIVNSEILDQEKVHAYLILAQESVKQYGGHYIVRGGSIELMEGTWAPHRLVVLQFESSTKAREWYSSEAYAAARELAKEAYRRDLIIVEGVD